MSDHYVLIGQTPVPVEIDLAAPGGEAALLAWARDAFHGPDRIVAQTSVLGVVWVSTVFLGLDHNYARILDPTLPPLLFESMAFWRPGRSDGYEQERCSTWLEAEAQHREMCRQVARPAAVLAWVARCWRGYWQAATEAWLCL